MNVNATNDLKEFNFNGNSSEYKTFITYFKTGVIILQKKRCEFYPIEIEKIEIEKIEIEKKSDSQSLITFSTEKDTLKLKGGNDKFNILLRSIENLSKSSKIGHFHIDNFGNSDLISQEHLSIVLNLTSLD